jgi:phage terminase large subunit
MFQRTTAVNKILKMKARKKVIQGSTSAGKTYDIIAILIDKAAKKPRLKITVVAETLPSVKEGAQDIFKTIMLDTNRWIEDNWNASSLTYTFCNKSRMQFKSFDTKGKAKASGKRDILFLNEANHISFEIADTLMIRSKETYIDFNPDNRFWVHTETLKEPNSEFLLLTWEDNEALPEETYEDLMIKKAKAFINPDLPEDKLFHKDNENSAYWVNWWKVYGMGEIGSLEGGVFSDKLRKAKNIPEYATFISYGMDYSNSGENNSSADPHSIHELWFADGCLYVKKIYEGNCNVTNQEQYIDENDSPGYRIVLNDDYSDIYSILSYKCPMLNAQCEYGIGACIADSANGANTNKLRTLGMNVIGYREFIKQNNLPNYSKIEAVKNLRSFDKIYIVEDGENTMSQFEELRWAKDKEEKIITDKIDWTTTHHAIDSVIYGSLAFSWS